MATLKTRWILSILLVNLPNCSFLGVSAGPPRPPSQPECYIPCDEKNCFVHIYCTWDPRQEPQIPTDYSLHWEPTSSEEEHVTNRTSLNSCIDRSHFRNHGELRVWVQAKNQHGSAKSQEAVFNTADILKPPSPKITSSHPEAIEIHWNSVCGQLQLSVGLCDVRYRADTNQVWLEDEEGFYGSYTIDNPQNCTAYEFQVRCGCATGLMSDWSAIHRIQGIETTPVGDLDVWMDCGISPANFDCVLTWKRLPMSQACALILGYEITLTYSNGTAVLVNVTTAGPRRQLVCDEMQCHFTSSIKDASSVSVSAYSTHGATRPSYLAMPVPGKEKNEQPLHLKMNSENLTVSWDPPSQLSDNVKEYVVQYKQAGCFPGQAFDWVKLNNSQTRAFFIGQFKNYTPYQVSLFSVSHKSGARHLSSVIGYSLQRAPSRVPSFKVLSIAATDVTLLWEPLPLSKQNGVILYYQIGLDGQKVYNVSALPQHENKTFQLQHLSPGQDYEVWIRAVTAAGAGEKATARFRTKHHEHFGYFSVFFGVISLLVMCLLLVVCAHHRKNKVYLLLPSCCFDKVPDPHNSHIFREMQYQINEPMPWICIPNNEPNPTMSVLEVLVIQPWCSKSSLEKTADADRLTTPIVWGGSSQMDCQGDQREDAVTEESHRTDHKCGREAYSKMVDSDEEKGWSSFEEEQCTSGYEKHFMPTALDVSCLHVDS